MPTLKELLDVEAADTPFSPADAGQYALHIPSAVVGEPTEREDGTQGHYQVNVRFDVVDPNGEFDGKPIFRRFYVNLARKQSVAFMKGLYSRVVGHELFDDINSDPPTEKEVAETFAAGVEGGRVYADVAVSEQKRYGQPTGKKENTIRQWLDNIE